MPSLISEKSQSIHTVSEMFKLASSSTTIMEEEVWDQLNEDTVLGMMQDKTKKTKKTKEEEFKVRHNPLYIELWPQQHTHVDYVCRDEY